MSVASIYSRGELMTGTQAMFEKSKKSDRIRKTIAFDPKKDRTLLDYIETKVKEGAAFSSVMKELALQQITLLKLAELHLDSQDCQTRVVTSQTRVVTEGKDELDSVFDDFMSTE